MSMRCRAGSANTTSARASASATSVSSPWRSSAPATHGRSGLGRDCAPCLVILSTWLSQPVAFGQVPKMIQALHVIPLVGDAQVDQTLLKLYQAVIKRVNIDSGHLEAKNPIAPIRPERIDLVPYIGLDTRAGCFPGVGCALAPLAMGLDRPLTSLIHQAYPGFRASTIPAHFSLYIV